VALALQYQPDIIVLDVLLPHLSGWEVLAQLKGNPVTQQIPVLVVSVVDERSQCVALGAADYLLKPISRQQFRAALQKVFATAPTSSPPLEARSPLILLAEDNEANIVTVSDYLQIQGYRLIVARNGTEAVQMALQQEPDLILMDIQMPEMDGLEATRRIRAEAKFATLPIIALTALAMPGDRDRCLAVGANEYLTKPVSLKELSHQIARYVPRTNV
jgi:CheY-like chemotaxis protein